MPWKETSVMDERIKFIGRLLSGKKIAQVCRECGNSRMEFNYERPHQAIEMKCPARIKRS